MLSQQLAMQPFLKGLNPDYLAFIAKHAAEVNFEKNHYILLEGREAKEFYLIQRGEVVLRAFISANRGFIDIETLGAGEILGWSWLIPPYHWHFSALVTQPVQAIAIDGVQLRQKCTEDHHFSHEIHRRLAQVVGKRLRRTRKQLRA